MISRLLFSSKIIMFMCNSVLYLCRSSERLFFCLGRNQIRLHDNNHMIKRYQNTSFIVFICALSGTPKIPRQRLMNYLRTHVMLIGLNVF
ncbi:hypothetical protein PUATCC27989T_02711 [Phytobacter ursingii]|nr:hypothetical protein PUATCC27989T_02711 [Phytobacter ursingii]